MPFRDEPAAINRLFYLALFAVCAGLLGDEFAGLVQPVL